MATSYVLLSGGLDSTVVLALQCAGHGAQNVCAISFTYGQRHTVELEAAKKVVAALGCEHRILDLRGVMGVGGLTDEGLQVPHVSYADLPEGISPTYVPFRNGLMLAAVASQAMADPQASVIAYGAHAEDAANDAYPDCSKAFVEAIAQAIYIGTYKKLMLFVPFVSATKAHVVREGARVNAPMHLSWSCYEGGDMQCGTCSTCRARKEAFSLAGIPDLTKYGSDM